MPDPPAAMSLPTTGVERPDVVQALGQAGLAKSGYNVVAGMSTSSGTYDLFIVHGGYVAKVCPLNAGLVLR